MKVILESKNNITLYDLPSKVIGNFWIEYNSENFINLEAKDNKWVLKSNIDVKINKFNSDNDMSKFNYIENIILEENNQYNLININNNEDFKLYTLPTYQYFDNFVIDYNQHNLITLGSNDKNDIVIKNDIFSKDILKIQYDKNLNKFFVFNMDKNNKLFVNNNYCDNCSISNGDSLFIAGLFVYFFGSLLLVSDNNKSVMYNTMKVNKRLVKENEDKDYSNIIDKEVKVYSKNDYFIRPPRFVREIDTKVIEIDSPTNKENKDEMPLIYTLGPMMLMGITSLMSGMTAIMNVIEGKSSFKENSTSIITSISMLISMIVFPLLQKFWQKRNSAKKERKRRRKYKKYINEKREEIFKEIDYQRQVLIDENLSPIETKKLIINRDRKLWDRKIEHNDFLNLRLGMGFKKPDIDIKYPEEHFTMEEDDLKDIIYELVNESKDIVDVPVSLSFKENNKTGLIGIKPEIYKFYDNLMLQVLAHHGYDMLRLIILTNSTNETYWEKYKNIPYLWNNDKSLRYYASNKEDLNKLTSYLMEEFNYRKEFAENKDLLDVIPYYLIIIDDPIIIKNNNFIKEILTTENKLGYSILMCVEKLDDLPNEAKMFLSINGNSGGVFSNKMNENNQNAFTPDYIDFTLRDCISIVSNLPMDVNSGKFVLPRKYGFLQMYDVGNVNQLNIINRWQDNDIINSLTCPVGIDEQGELFDLDLHEKAHGPHGLVAGMTGSGKSEWIITYILSMAVNYSPEEVQFVLIDYKGGGLALTFDNKENNIKLPHVVGTITNLDIVEIKRSLASINSELKRRQSMFKTAREQLNESSMDIYKYQKYYRAKKLKEPISHLFIISDEFAELKAQQPEFMEELISTARIGRSLGVHLILATQKPSGVVDDQIWSNSKFKVCLKVQDKSDSNDMLKCPDAAMLKETGRFYLLVGYNEFFAKGQSAYAGTPYYESDKKVVIVDSSVEFLTNIGIPYKEADIEKNNVQFEYKGEELPNILDYIISTAKNEDLQIKPLWLPNVPAIIYVDDLKVKYDYKKKDYDLDVVIGEYDNPSKQTQGLLTVPISAEGNVLLYGSTGSGKENFITTMIYSLISTYSIDEVNIYILDFGSEVLNNYEICPYIGDIIHNGDNEKIINLFKFIDKEISSRKSKFTSFNGNYQDYIKKTKEDKLPNIVVFINSFDIFIELYEDYIDKMSELTRDCAKYGIYFVLSSSSSSGVKLKISQNFKLIYTLQQNDESDYKTVLSSTENVVPSKIFGRGLVKLDKVLEFQTAYAKEKNNLYDELKLYSIRIFTENNKKADPIPVLPKVVYKKDIISQDEVDIKSIPIGIYKKSLEIVNLNLKKILGYIITAKNIDDYIYFIDNFMKILDILKDCSTFIFDTQYIYDNVKFNNVCYTNNNFTKFLNQINDYTNKIDEFLNENNGNIKTIKTAKDVVLLIVGFDKFFNNLSFEDKQTFENIISQSKANLKIHIIYIDSANSLKKYEYDQWFTDSVDTSNGIWLGDGFADQLILKPSKILNEYYDSIGFNMGYVLDNGSAGLIKVVEDFSDKKGTKN